MEEIIRERFRKSGLSIKRLTDLAESPYASVHDFLVGKGTVTLPTADKLCRVLGLVLVKQKRGKVIYGKRVSTRRPVAGQVPQ